MRTKNYLHLIRLRYYPTFLFVVAGALYSSKTLSWHLTLSLLVLYVLFVLFLYTGIYTVNDISDMEADKKHSLKSNRPLPSGKINKKSAEIFAATMIAVGLIGGFLYLGLATGILFIAFIIINIFYTFFVKNVPFLELLTNSITYPLRFFMGSIVAGGGVPPLIFLLAILFFTVGFACVRRAVEKDIKGWDARQVLKVYKGNVLFLIQIVSLLGLIASLAEGKESLWLTLPMVAGYIFLVFGIYLSPRVRSVFINVWGK